MDKQLNWQERKQRNENGMYVCELCEREIQKITDHHLIPRKKRHQPRTSEAILSCITCHGMVHRIYSNKELRLEFNTLEKLRQAPKLQKYLAWVKTKKKENFTLTRKKQKRKPRR